MHDVWVFATAGYLLRWLSWRLDLDLEAHLANERSSCQIPECVEGSRALQCFRDYCFSSSHLFWSSMHGLVSTFVTLRSHERALGLCHSTVRTNRSWPNYTILETCSGSKGTSSQRTCILPKLRVWWKISPTSMISGCLSLFFLFYPVVKRYFSFNLCHSYKQCSLVWENPKSKQNPGLRQTYGTWNPPQYSTTSK